MRKQFVADIGPDHLISVKKAGEICPWANFYRRCQGGIWCFESLADAKQWDAQK